MMERLADILKGLWRSTRQFLFSRDALTFVCFVLVAGIMWYGHAISSEREATLHVPVRYSGIPQDVVFEPALPDHLDVTIRDAGRRLIAQSEDVPVITFDLSDMSKETELYAECKVSSPVPAIIGIVLAVAAVAAFIFLRKRK